MSLIKDEYLKKSKAVSMMKKKKGSMMAVDEEELIEDLKIEILALLNSDKFKIPMFPSVAQELMQIIDSKKVDFDKIAAIIKKDQFLGAKLLKIANSPVYKSRYPAGKIEDAVRRLGLEEVKKLLFMISMSHFVVKKGTFANMFQDFWRHSIVAAEAAKQISRILKVDSSYAYIAGLLHDIGRTFVLMALEEMSKKTGDSSFFHEAILLKLTKDIHVDAGDIISQKWHLPGSIEKSIKYHHNIARAKKEQIPLIVYVSEKLANYYGFGDEEKVSSLENEPSLYFLGFDGKKIELLDEKLEQVFKNIEELT